MDLIRLIAESGVGESHRDWDMVAEEGLVVTSTRTMDGWRLHSRTWWPQPEVFQAWYLVAWVP
jgi:hypothetical protein